MFSSVKKLLRSPKLILGEISALALLGAIGAVQSEWHVFSSLWFVALTAVTALSLAVVVVEQFRRLRAGWTQQLTEAHFNSAPFRAEFERPATVSQPVKKIWSDRRLGLAGSLVFHSGLLLLILAGMLRALFAAEAVTDVVETETLAAKSAAWPGQFPGVLAQPFSLDREVTLREVRATRYADGDLNSLSVRISSGGSDRDVQINQEARFGDRRLYLGHEFGPAALLEWKRSASAPAEKHCLMLADSGRGNFAGKLAGAGGLRVHLRSHIDNAGNRPDALEVRVMNGSALVSALEMGVGATLALPDGGSLTLRGLPLWARLHGSRDSALLLAFAGMILAMLGATMMFTLIKRDYCLVVTPLGDREKVFVALKPQRFAPLFQERFEKLISELGGNNSIAGIMPKPVERFPLSPGERAGVRADVNALIPIQHDPTGVPLRAVRTASWLLLASSLAFTAGCDPVSPTQARQLVERYNQVVSEAYRRGDVRLVDPVVGPNEGKKLTGLIGVRLDMGITLDSKLDSLEITGVEQAKNQLLVRTKERWRYRDLKIGSGAQVGQASQDAYEMTYFFTNVNKAWLVDEIKFASPPQVGRTNTPWVADRAVLHGTTKPEAKP